MPRLWERGRAHVPAIVGVVGGVTALTAGGGTWIVADAGHVTGHLQ